MTVLLHSIDSSDLGPSLFTTSSIDPKVLSAVLLQWELRVNIRTLNRDIINNTKCNLTDIVSQEASQYYCNRYKGYTNAFNEVGALLLN